jgi:hypothetical protein
MPKVKDIKYMGLIESVMQHQPDFMLTTDSQDVEAIWDYFGNDEDVKQFDGFFVKIKDGDYSRVYGFYGNVPFNWKEIYEVIW